MAKNTHHPICRNPLCEKIKEKLNIACRNALKNIYGNVEMMMGKNCRKADKVCKWDRNIQRNIAPASRGL